METKVKIINILQSREIIPTIQEEKYNKQTNSFQRAVHNWVKSDNRQQVRQGKQGL